MSNKIHVRKDDMVEVLAGKDRGKKGKVLEVQVTKGRVVVDGVNVVKRHMKPRPPAMPQGGIVEKSLGIASSNVMLVCPRCNKSTRPASKVQDNAQGVTRVRVCKKCGEEI